jgi:DNA integrity scanning protein DisA with diadenylate cyclase activity
MGLPRQTVVLLQSARQLLETLPADAVLLLTETNLDWDEVREHLNDYRLLVAAQDAELTAQIKQQHPGLTVLDIDPGPTPTQERMSLALLEAVQSEQIHPGAHVVVLYNGIEVGRDHPEHIDSVSVLHLGEHLERLSAKELRNLDTQVPLETLRAVVDLATEIGQEGREGHPVGALFVVGDTRNVLKYCHSINYNPFKGYAPGERDVRDRKTREQIKEISKLDGAIIIRRNGVAEAASMYLDVPTEGISLSKGLGSRHWAAAGISKKTKAIAVAVSQSAGTVRIFQDGDVVLRIEPFARPMVWRQPEVETLHTGDGVTNAAAAAQ